jgi:hypothetical protein
MSRNPYAHPMEPADATAAQARVSALAVSSLIFGLLCCLPGAGLIGVVLGGAGLIRISQSEGRLGGRALAFVGLALGLFGTALWLSIAVGGMYGLTRLAEYGTVIKDFQKPDLTAARGMLSPTASSALSDESAAAFKSALDAELGAYQRLPKGLAEWFTDYGRVGDAINRAGTSTQTGPKIQIPLPGHFDKGVALIMIYADGTATGSTGAAAVTNIAIHAPSGKIIWLIPPEGGNGAKPPVETPAPPPTPDATPK